MYYLYLHPAAASFYGVKFLLPCLAPPPLPRWSSPWHQAPPSLPVRAQNSQLTPTLSFRDFYLSWAGKLRLAPASRLALPHLALSDVPSHFRPTVPTNWHHCSQVCCTPAHMTVLLLWCISLWLPRAPNTNLIAMLPFRSAGYAGRSYHSGFGCVSS